jgi:hypothetical protein
MMAAVVLGVAGCATTSMGKLAKDASPEAKAAAVTRKAEARWDALMKGDVKAAYAALSPASRALTSLEQYQARTRVGSFREVKLDKVSCEAETCRARFWLTFDHRVMKGVTTPIEETWVIEDGEPWLVYRE